MYDQLNRKFDFYIEICRKLYALIKVETYISLSQLKKFTLETWCALHNYYMWLTRNRLDVFLVSSLINLNEYYSLVLRLFLMTVINLSPPLKMQHGDKQMFKLEITIEEINVFIHLWVKRSIEVVLIPSLLTLNKLSKRINIGISLVSVFTKQLLRVCLQISLLTLT